jgi:hypothetical protein
VRDQIRQQILGPKRVEWLQEIGNVDNRVVAADDAECPAIERGNTHHASLPNSWSAQFGCPYERGAMFARGYLRVNTLSALASRHAA